MGAAQTEIVKWLARLIGTALLCAAAYLRGEDAAVIDQAAGAELRDALATWVTATLGVAAWLIGQWMHRRQTGGLFAPSGRSA